MYRMKFGSQLAFAPFVYSKILHITHAMRTFIFRYYYFLVKMVNRQLRARESTDAPLHRRPLLPLHRKIENLLFGINILTGLLLCAVYFCFFRFVSFVCCCSEAWVVFICFCYYDILRENNSERREWRPFALCVHWIVIISSSSSSAIVQMKNVWFGCVVCVCGRDVARSCRIAFNANSTIFGHYIDWMPNAAKSL